MWTSSVKTSGVMTSCVWTSSVKTSCVWTSSGDKWCDEKWCVDKLCVSTSCADGMQNQKQEPHTKMWGTIAILGLGPSEHNWGMSGEVVK